MYAHLNKIIVDKDEKIKKGQTVALSGNTGMSTGAHLHYCVCKNDEFIDTMNIINMPYTKEVEKEYKVRGELFIEK